MSGAIAERANDTTKALGGKISYLWATVAVFSSWQNSEIRLSVDDEIRGGRMHDVVVANGRCFGGGMKICPDAEPDDGLFDVLTIGDLTKRDLLTTLPKTFWGKHLPHPKAELLRGAVVTVDSDGGAADRARRRAARHDAGPLRDRPARAARARSRLGSESAQDDHAAAAVDTSLQEPAPGRGDDGDRRIRADRSASRVQRLLEGLRPVEPRPPEP